MDKRKFKKIFLRPIKTSSHQPMFKSIASKQASSSPSTPVKPTKPIVSFADQLAAVIKSTERKPEDAKRKDLPLDIAKYRKRFDDTIIPIKDSIVESLVEGLPEDEAKAVIKDYYENEYKNEGTHPGNRIPITLENTGGYTKKKFDEFISKYRANKKKSEAHKSESSSDDDDDFTESPATSSSDSKHSSKIPSKKSAFTAVKSDSKRTKLADLSEADKAERHREQMKAWRQAHPDYNKTYRQRYYEENRDKILQKRREKRAEEKKQLEDYKKHMLSKQASSTSDAEASSDEEDVVEYKK